LRKHLKNILFILFSFAVGFSLFSWGLQQLDIVASSLIFQYAMNWVWGFPWTRWDAYLLRDVYPSFFGLVIFGFIVAYAGLFVALWWWSE